MSVWNRRNRLGAAGAAALVVLATSGCGAIPSSGAAVTIEGQEISVDSFERLLGVVVENEDLFQITADPATNTVQAAQARSVLNLLVGGEATERYLAASGESITDADRQTFEDQLGADNPVFDLPDDIVGALVDSQAGQTAVARVPAISAEEMRALYEDEPAALGILCVRHVQLNTEAEAQAVLDELAGGAAIEDLAAERSTEENAATTGGALQADAEIDCAPESGIQERFGDDFVEAALASRPGSPSGPVQTGLGWHVVEAQAYDDIAESLGALYGQIGPQLQLTAFTRGLDVQVDPRYGRWDPATGTVGAL